MSATPPDAPDAPDAAASQSGVRLDEVVLPRGRLAEIIAKEQAAGARCVFTNGVYDLLHVGHIQLLWRARALGDLLVVGLNSDASTRRLKGPTRPLIPQGERAEIMAALAMVDYVTIFDDDTASATLAALRPAVYVKGGDYAAADPSERARDYLVSPDDLRRRLSGAPAEQVDGGALAALRGLAERLPEARAVAEYGGALALLAYLPGHSTSELIARIASRNAPTDAQRAP